MEMKVHCQIKLSDKRIVDFLNAYGLEIYCAESPNKGSYRLRYETEGGSEHEVDGESLRDCCNRAVLNAMYHGYDISRFIAKMELFGLPVDENGTIYID